MKTITTERLLIREFIVADADFIFELLNTPQWIQFIGDRGIKTKEDAELYIANGPMASYEENDFGLWMVQLKDGLTPVGMCGLIKRDFLDDVDIGFAFLPQFFKKGYAMESASAVLNYAWSNLKFNRVLAITNQDNVHCIQLLKRLGMGFEKIIQFPGDGSSLSQFSISC